jgi:hypothetical protein
MAFFYHIVTLKKLKNTFCTTEFTEVALATERLGYNRAGVSLCALRKQPSSSLGFDGVVSTIPKLTNPIRTSEFHYYFFEKMPSNQKLKACPQNYCANLQSGIKN